MLLLDSLGLFFMLQNVKTFHGLHNTPLQMFCNGVNIPKSQIYVYYDMLHSTKRRTKLLLYDVYLQLYIIGMESSFFMQSFNRYKT